jgi:hypothetical protein
MWPWIKRWRDWVMLELWPLYRMGSQPQALHYSYEKAGLTVPDQPIPWNAEAVLVEASLRLPTPAARRKTDFKIRLADHPLYPADNLRPLEGDQRYRLSFRLRPLAATATVELVWKEKHVLGQLTLPVLGRDEFVNNVRLQMPTLFVRLGNETVACQTFVSSQCKGLQAAGVLTSPTSLVPLLDLDLQVEFRSERGGTAMRVPARLSSSQLAGRQALVSVVPRQFKRRQGTWLVTWFLGDRPLASHRIQAISQYRFQRSLRVADTRFVVQAEKSGVVVSRQIPPLESVERIGPCFLVCSREPGMAGLCPLLIRAQVPGSVSPPVLLEQEFLITDGPTPVAPGTVDAADLTQVSSFEICLKGQVLSALSLCPAPSANFTSEGGFKAPTDYAWSSAADEELSERLAKLMEGFGKGE